MIFLIEKLLITSRIEPCPFRFIDHQVSPLGLVDPVRENYFIL
jgi:hypothetical protein